MTTKHALSRREYLRLLLIGGGAAAGSLALSGCGSSQSAESTAASRTTAPAATTVPASTAATKASEPTVETVANTEGAAAPTVAEQPMAETAARASEPTSGASADLAIAHGSSPTALVQAALAALGGIEAFVKPGDDVIVKPNIVAADYGPEYAAYTNPEVVGAITALCVEAGAGRVRAMDRPSSSTCAQVYSRSGIGDAVEAAGGEMEVMSSVKYRDAAIPEGRDISSWSVYGDILDADVVINVPIAKHHRLSKATLSMKNLMGVIESRNQFHPNLGQRIADLASLVRPTLTIMDAVNVLKANGPRGGSLGDVQQFNTIVAGTDFVAVGAYSAAFVNQDPSNIDALRCADEMGLGTLDYDSLIVSEVSA